MKSSNSSCQGIVKILCIITAVSLLTGLFSSCAPAATPGPGTATANVTPTPVPEAWRLSMAQAPLPKKGCFQSSYPSKDWQEVSCTTAPPYPYIPRRPPRALIVGNGNDASAQVPTGHISTAIGSFDSVTGVTSESGPVCSGASVADAYSLQLNTNFFYGSTACNGAANPAVCQGWEQFVFANDGSSGAAFIQYWLISYNTTCPTGWFSYTYPGPTDISCYKNDNNGAVSVPNQPITNLGQLQLSGSVGAGGDNVTLSTGTNIYSIVGDNAVDAAQGWTIAEFIVVGDACGAQANFNNGSTIVPRTRVTYGDIITPTCVVQGFTGETNNLSFGPNAPAVSQPGPALMSTQSSAGGATSTCAAAVTVGDTHLQTFLGLFYDFQASGDFVLAQVDPDFVVQARQVSGAPTWPDASVNNAVATQMGKTQVAICLAQTPLNINGKPAELDDGKSLPLGDGVDVWRIGNAYLITDQNGNSIRAEVNPTWINVSVGLGRWPTEVHGLLANANGNVNQIAARDGTVLEVPFSFEDLYTHYANSWRVPPYESLLSVCGGKAAVEHGIPKGPFYANDLDAKIQEDAKMVCKAAGVKEGPLLDACTLDVAVIGDKAAAKVFVGASTPIAVGFEK
ncbi:hypothetical protein ANAEL_00753 [Anaerolineales bacterium]|nr:hypothetical protein ANAEL_00753 [Anaerolineales bacterium]